MRIAMWSGPRNISTAMMRSFGSRPDTAVTDEPLYAHYLKVTGVAHPGRDEVIAAQETDWRKVTDALDRRRCPAAARSGTRSTWPITCCRSIGRDWLDRLTHAFLIREPDEMLASLLQARFRTPGLADTGLPQQWEIFDRVAERTRPRAAGRARRATCCATRARMLTRLCATRSAFRSSTAMLVLACRAGATRTASGRRTGTRRSRPRRASSPGRRRPVDAPARAGSARGRMPALV